jgi:hypothetical protein
MADRQFTSTIPHVAEVPASMRQAAITWERIALKWRDLAERRHAHYVELYKSGRWTHYYTEEEFRSELRDAIALAQRWGAIAPTRDERDQAAGIVRQVAA